MVPSYEIKHGDCTKLLPQLPAHSVELVLVDPPYGIMKDIDNYAWTDERGRSKKFQNMDWDCALDPKFIFSQSCRVLKPFGRCILFSQEPYTSRLIVNAIDTLSFSQRAFWKKESFANALSVGRKLSNYTEDIVIFSKKGYDENHSHPLYTYFLEEKEKCKGISFKKLLGNGMANHYFTKGSQFQVPKEDAYLKLQSTGHFSRPYSEIMAIHQKWLKERGHAVFNLWQGKKSKSNIFEYKRDKEKFHPTQKPVALLEDLIRTYSNEGATVLDFCMGSGSTGIAALNSKRNFIGIEKDENFFNFAQKRLKDWRGSDSL